MSPPIGKAISKPSRTALRSPRGTGPTGASFLIAQLPTLMPAEPASYRGRFAPSPTGRLHAGSLAAALASRLDAHAHDGVWLVRIEDIDPPRDIPGAGEDILATLARLGMPSDEPVLWQHERMAAYEEAFAFLKSQGALYGCACSRKEIAAAALARGLPPNVYPGTCRSGTNGRAVRAWRFRVPAGRVAFRDRALGGFSQDVEHEAGDFVVKRADGLWAYQLAVTVDDIAQRITDIVRGADLTDNTPRQILLYRAFGREAPRYMHIPLVLNDRGEKLSKQAGARALNDDALLSELEHAFEHLGFPRIGADSIAAFHRAALALWREKLEALPFVRA